MLRWRVGLVVAVLASVAWLGMGTVPTSAATPKPPKFSGAAPGAVSCAASVKLKFSSPLTLLGGVMSTSVSAKLKSCAPSVSGLLVKKGELTGSFAGSPINCVGPSAGNAAGTFSVSWKGKVDGAVQTVTYKGKATFTTSPAAVTGEALVTNGSGQVGLQLLATDSGSFPGGLSLSVYSTDSESQIEQLCETRTTTPAGKGKGIKTLKLSGSATVGAVGQVVSDGSGFCAAVASGTVECWGSGTDGALGDDNTTNSRVPVIIGVTSATGLVSDGTHSYCAVLASGGVDCWGLNTDGELGDGSAASDSIVPVAVSGVSGAVALASDQNHSYCALTVSGAADCWGLGTSGELGNGQAVSSEVAVAVFGLSGAVSLASGGDGSYCAVVAGGGVECWGDNGNGDLGDGSTTQSDVPVPVTGMTAATAVVSDGGHSYCALVAAGAVECWGLGTSGELGNGGTATSHVPVSVTGVSGALSLASDASHSYCAVLATGAVDCWGVGTSGQLGDGQTSSSDVPEAATGISDAAGITGDDLNSYCAVLATETVECWGVGGSGQLGNNQGTDSDVPVVAGPMDPAMSLVGQGGDDVCAALVSDGVACWGDNTAGALGNNSGASDSLVPVTVSDLTL